MTRAVLECVGGASGNMLLGALIDAGVDPTILEGRLRRLPLPDWRLEVSRVRRLGIAAVHVEVRHPEEDVQRHLPEIVRIIEAAALPEDVRSASVSVFERLADAEGAVHGISRDAVHFHEVGAVDAVIDIVGVALGMHLLGIERLDVAPLPVGTGPIHCAHGEMPNPAPATAELLRGVPVRFTDIPGELVTPTGAALLVTLGRFATSPAQAAIDRIGYGAGTRDSRQVPNVVRLLTMQETASAEHDQVVQIDTNLDDMNPQVFEHAMQRLFERGALDVYLTPIYMKKNRPATMLSVLCRPGDEQALCDVVLEETTTLGVRMKTLQRRTLQREIRIVDTSLGTVRVKLAGRGGRVQPEYDDCLRIARERGIPLLDVLDRVRREAGALEQEER